MTRKPSGKKFESYKETTREIYKDKKGSIQRLIPVNRIARDGIFEIEAGDQGRERLFDKAYVLKDTNYVTKDEDEKELFLKGWCRVLNSMNTSAKIVIMNNRRDMEQFELGTFIRHREGEPRTHGELVENVNHIIREKAVDGAGRIEQDLEYCVYAQPDFITIDGRGGATGASPRLVRDATSVPTVYALARAKKYLDSVGSDIDLVITGGLRVSSDFAKAIAMGASAVAVASAAMVALGCEQYRICGSGKCPMGIATQDPELRKRLDCAAGEQRVANYFRCAFEELKTFARITGHSDIHDLTTEDLVTVSDEIANHTDIRHA